MKWHTFFLALLVFGVHGLHTFFNVQPRIGNWNIDLPFSWLVVLYSGIILGKLIYSYFKK